DQRARLAEIPRDVVAVDEDAARAGVDDAADHADQRGLAGAVGAEQREDLAAADLEVDPAQGMEARLVGLVELLDGNDRRHVRPRGRWRLRAMLAEPRPALDARA